MKPNLKVPFTRKWYPTLPGTPKSQLQTKTISNKIRPTCEEDSPKNQLPNFNPTRNSKSYNLN
jgi:hypothetical protein